MRKVLIVDDESFVSSSVKSMLERHPDFTFETETCSNGLEALTILEQQHFDILITDIRMPELDGIGLITFLKEKQNRPEIIILSENGEFSYALEAMRCGVRDYLLKPVNREELFEALNRIEKHMKEKEEYLREVKLAKSCIEYYKITELKYILLKDDISKREIIDSIAHIDQGILKGNFYLGLIKRKSLGVDCDFEGLIMDIDDILASYEDRRQRSYTIYQDPDKNLILISKKLELFIFIKEHFHNKNIFRYYIGLCDYCSSPADIKTAYKKANKALLARLYYNNRYFIKYSEIENRNVDYSLPKDSIERLVNMLGTGRAKEIEKLIMEVMDFNIIMKYDISYLIELCSEIKKMIIYNVERKYFNGQEVYLNNHEKLKSLNNYNSFPEYFHDLKNYIMDVDEYIRNLKDVYGDKKLIDRAIEYIHKNYERELNLSLVSNEISMNYSYFSQMFKDYTGENFVNYVKRIRIEKAKELLRNPDYKVYEIADKVGIVDSKQFTKIFRKVTGISPTEFRDKYVSK